MIAAMRAELTKLRKRPATWVLVGVILLLSVVFGYLIPFLLLDSDAFAQAGISRAEVLAELVPAGFVSSAIQGFPMFDFGLILILGGLAVGSEYGWGTIGATLVQRPGRIAVYLGRVLAIAAIAALATLGIFGLASLASLVIGAVEGAPTDWPSFGTILRGLGAGWLILSVAVVLGAVVGTLLRTTSLAVGLGLVYVFVIEPLLVGFSSQSTVIESIARVLPGANAGAVASGLATSAASGNGAPGLNALVGTGTGAIALGAYLVGLVVLGLVVFVRRDVAE